MSNDQQLPLSDEILEKQDPADGSQGSHSSLTPVSFPADPRLVPALAQLGGQLHGCLSWKEAINNMSAVCTTGIFSTFCLVWRFYSVSRPRSRSRLRHGFGFSFVIFVSSSRLGLVAI